MSYPASESEGGWPWRGKAWPGAREDGAAGGCDSGWMVVEAVEVVMVVAAPAAALQRYSLTAAAPRRATAAGGCTRGLRPTSKTSRRLSAASSYGSTVRWLSYRTRCVREPDRRPAGKQEHGMDQGQAGERIKALPRGITHGTNCNLSFERLLPTQRVRYGCELVCRHVELC